MLDWKESEKELPKLGIYIIGRSDRGTWHDSDDNEGCNYVIVKRQMVEGWKCANNLKDYEWKEFGPDCFFGQDISHWAYFNAVNEDKITAD